MGLLFCESIQGVLRLGIICYLVTLWRQTACCKVTNKSGYREVRHLLWQREVCLRRNRRNILKIPLNSSQAGQRPRLVAKFPEKTEESSRLTGQPALRRRYRTEKKDESVEERTSPVHISCTITPTEESEEANCVARRSTNPRQACFNQLSSRALCLIWANTSVAAVSTHSLKIAELACFQGVFQK